MLLMFKYEFYINYFARFVFLKKINLYAKIFLGFSVYISNTTHKEDGVLCFKDTRYTKVTIPNPINISCQYHGIYVIYYNNRTHLPYPNDYDEYAYNELCEVEVNGTEGFLSLMSYICLDNPGKLSLQ